MKHKQTFLKKLLNKNEEEKLIKEKCLPLKHIINKNDAVCIGFKCSVIFTHDENNKKKQTR